MAFVRRTTPPLATDPNYIRWTYGGNSHAMAINEQTGCVLANCCGNVHGRVLENAGSTVESKICRSNACDYWGYTADGLRRSQTPALGAIMVWSSTGSNRYGHVSVVEAIDAQGNVTASNSNYKGTWWYESHHTKASNYALYSSKSTYYFKGFILMPDDIKKVGSPVQRDETKHQIEVTYAALRARKRPEINPAVVLGYANMGYYNVLQTRDMTYEPSNGYFWFEIEDDMWVAYVDGAVNDLPAVEPTPDEIQQLKEENKQLKLDIISLELTVEKLRGTIDEIAALAHYN